MSTGLADPVLDEVLVALADPTRRAVLDALTRRGSGSASTLAHEVPVTRQAVVKHLAVLEHAGLVKGRRRGREVRFEVRPGPLATTAERLAQVAHEWDRRLVAIKRIAEGPSTARD